MQNAKLQFKIKEFQQIVKKFYKNHKRDFPWRRTRNPYHILVSEIMLQQTQVSRVLEKYPHFIKRFPTPIQLARAPLSAVLKEWSGLGYNRRAKFLKNACEIVVVKHHGLVPKTLSELEALPGIGKSTAGGILAFAYSAPTVFIETNIRRVFLHHFFPHQKDVPDSSVLSLVEKTLDRTNLREWYYALFDYGTYLARQFPNPNRRSRHYTKQARFIGSRRQLRGQILKMLVSAPHTEIQILQSIRAQGHAVPIIMQELIAEKFLEKKGVRYMLK